MHEASLVHTLLRQVRDIADAHDGARVAAVSVTIGEFSGVEPDLLEIAFEQQIAETPMAGARFILSRVPLAGLCSQCECEFEIKDFHFICPRCGHGGVRIVRGEEMILQSVRLEEVNATAPA